MATGLRRNVVRTLESNADEPKVDPKCTAAVARETETVENETKYVMEFITENEFWEFFVEHMWPSMTGFGKKLDTYYKSSEAEYYHTVKDRKIRFNDAAANDPDWKVKQG